MDFQNFSSKSALLVLALLSVSCGSGNVSRAPVDPAADANAEAALAARQKQTTHFRGQIQSLNKLLKPIDAALSDMSKALPEGDAATPEAAAVSRLKAMVSILRAFLREAGQGWVEIHDDGSWTVGRSFPLGADRGTDACKSSQLLAEGTGAEGAERFAVSVGDCAFEKPVEVLSGATESGSLRVKLNLGAFNAIAQSAGAELIQQVPSFPCDVSVSEGKFDLACSGIGFPVTAPSTKKTYTVIVNPLRISGSDKTTSATLQVDVLDADAVLRGRVQLDGAKLRYCPAAKIDDCPSLAPASDAQVTAP